MLSARLIEPGRPLSLDEVPVPQPRGDEVLVRIGGAGLCHSDLHVVSGALRPYPELPWILGHENAGWVEAIGPEVRDAVLGAPVAVFGGWGCGICRLCIAGDEHLCDLMRWVGHGLPGGFAQHLLVSHARYLVPLGEVDPIDAAPLTDAGLTAYRATMRVMDRVSPSGTLVVAGIGGLGHHALQFLRLMTPATIVAVETSASRRALARELGADVVLDPAATDVAAEVRRVSGGVGADAALDFVGADATLATLTASLAVRGRLVLVGLAGGRVPFAFKGLPFEAELTTSSWGSIRELTEVVALARAGKIRSRVETFPLVQINDAIRRLGDGEVDGRIVIVP